MPLDQERAARIAALDEPAPLPGDGELRSWGFQAPVPRGETAMRRIAAAPYKGAERDPDRTPLRAIPDALVWAARKEHEDALDALEAFRAAAAPLVHEGLADTELSRAWLRAGAVLRGNGRPKPTRAHEFSDWSRGVETNAEQALRLRLVGEAVRTLAGAMGEDASAEADPLDLLLRLAALSCRRPESGTEDS